jgi:glycosyltransferase involved in cell wall biosynthesis
MPSSDHYAMLISVCIPTFKRLALCLEAVQSCFEQKHRPMEIVIGDDSPTDQLREELERLPKMEGICIRYQWNSPSLGQAANMNSLIRRVQGERLLLLHDDDLLLPGALDNLSDCWKEYPELTVAYGKQYVISPNGVVDQTASEHLNADYFRDERWAGLQKSSCVAGILQQLPNDGYMIVSHAAKSIDWRPRAIVGNGCEYDFGLRLALQYEGFYFLNRYTAKYRVTTESMSKTGKDDAAMQSYLILREADVPREAEWAKNFQLNRFAPGALGQFSKAGRRKEALHLYFSSHYPWKRRLRPRGLFELARALGFA